VPYHEEVAPVGDTALYEAAGFSDPENRLNTVDFMIGQRFPSVRRLLRIAGTLIRRVLPLRFTGLIMPGVPLLRLTGKGEQRGIMPGFSQGFAHVHDLYAVGVPGGNQ
jgi:hypothetical protein